ncbi:GNAT family N-acetyltransferase [Streptomyces sp. TR06-5]|uniref:GNAT family N-acetyltransferase n=1 Tax=Streptomyces sp. TR06-5 TaxID=3385976 RepID=UPI0039A27AD2
MRGNAGATTGPRWQAEVRAARLFLWVVEENTRARRFYRRAGFAPDGARDPFEVGGRSLTDLRWVRDLQGGAAGPNRP